MTRKGYLEKQRNLPSFLKDFHDQKDFFKTIDEWLDKKENDLDNISWIQAHIYTIDNFLWFMGMHGYTLQKSRAKIEFHDIYETLDEFNKKRLEKSASFLKNIMNSNKANP